MRAIALTCLVFFLALAIGCTAQTVAEAEAPSPPAESRQSLTLYPLSDPQPVAPLQNWSQGPTNLVVANPDYGLPPQGYAEAPGTTYYDGAGTVTSTGGVQYYSGPIIIPDPPVIVNQTQTYAVTGQAYSYETTTTYSAPTYAAPVTTYSAPAATYTAPATSYPAPTYAAPVTTYSAPATTYTAPATGYPAPTYATPAPTYAGPTAPYAATPTYSTSITTAPAPYSAPYAAPAVAAATGQYQLVPAPDIPPGNHPNDAGPSQWFEIIRPDNGPIRIGRLSSTCVCVGVRVPKRDIAAGERALIEARTMTRPPYNNLTYGIYVGIQEPVKQTLDVDVTIRL